MSHSNLELDLILTKKTLIKPRIIHFTASQFVNAVLNEWPMPMSDLANSQGTGESNQIEYI